MPTYLFPDLSHKIVINVVFRLVREQQMRLLDCAVPHSYCAYGEPICFNPYKPNVQVPRNEQMC